MNTTLPAGDTEVARAAQLDCAAISDALDRLQIAGQCHGIAPRDPNFRLAGRAYTVLYRLAEPGEHGHVGDFIDDVAPGSVICIDNAGRDNVGTWGNILTEGKSTIEVAWWLSLYPGLAILVTVLGYNLFGEGLRDVLDPRLRER